MKQQTGTSPLIGRRAFLQIIAAAGAAGALWQFGLRPELLPGQVIRESRVMMGTQVNLIIYGPDRESCKDAVYVTFARMEELIGILSRHSSGSDLYRLNKNGFLPEPRKEMREVLLLAEGISKATEGAFDVSVLPLLKLYSERSPQDTLPADHALHETMQLVDYRKINISRPSITLEKMGMALTLDGIGKGYIVDQGVSTLKSKGFSNVYVEAGGDLMVSGVKTGNKPWRIGISNPRPESSASLVALRISDRAVATSGDYMQPFSPDMRHHHIIDPRTGISPPELASATVTAPTVALADGLATAAMVMGPGNSLELLESMDNCEGFFISKELKQYRTSGFPS
jgi:thiamine biosynthesis lipoprotein